MSKIPDNLIWKMYDAMAPIPPIDTLERVQAVSRLALELMEHSYNVGRAEAGTMRTFNEYIADYEQK